MGPRPDLLLIGRSRFRCRTDAVEQLGAGNERNAEARRGQYQAGISGIALQIMNAALDRADGDGVGHQIRLRAGLDDEKSADLSKHVHR